MQNLYANFVVLKSTVLQAFILKALSFPKLLSKG